MATSLERSNNHFQTVTFVRWRQRTVRSAWLVAQPGALNAGHLCFSARCDMYSKGKASPYSITERRVPELIPVLGSQPAGDVSHIPGGRLPLLSARPAVTPATLKRAATNFSCLVNKGTMGVNSLPKTVFAYARFIRKSVGLQCICQRYE